AIRPTNLNHPPEQIKKFLNADQFKIYSLIWKRFIASQMNPAIYDTVAAMIETNANLNLKVTGSTLKFKGFLAAYQEKSDTEDADEKENLLPPLVEGQRLKLIEVKSEQAFTRPPPRFSEASLIKELEKSGIGRPSTFTSITNKIQSRSYTTKEKLYLKPTELGRVIVELLDTSFAMIMDVGFTAAMEHELDEIAEGHREWKAFVREFWDKFNPLMETAEKEAHVPKQDTDIDCPECGSKLQKIWAKNKYFYGCSRYPDCGFTSALEGLSFNKEDYAKDFDWDQPCPKCGGKMQVRHGRYGPFLGCTKYPECKGIVNIQQEGDAAPEDLPNCPAIGCTGKLTQRRSRYGKVFYSCTEYPDCDVIGNEVDQVLEKYKDHPKTPYVKKAGKAGGKRGSGGPKYKLSKDLAAITGEKEMTRGEVTKALWVYIKEHNLQDPKNKRRIIPDDKLKKIFSEPIDMMQLAGTLKGHLSK
ncbi:MAG TPA: DNA topoisomerase, partial [Chlamydiales bacterium]|nr:DNA topoisomerase [Chlamydiales bacterium]